MTRFCTYWMIKIFFQKSGRVTFLTLSISKCMPSWKKIVSAVFSNFLSHPSRSLCVFGSRAPLKWRTVPPGRAKLRLPQGFYAVPLIDMCSRGSEFTLFTFSNWLDKNLHFYKQKVDDFLDFGPFLRDSCSNISTFWKRLDLRIFLSVQNQSPLYSEALRAKSLFYFSRKIQKTSKNDTFFDFLDDPSKILTCGFRGLFNNH